MNDMKSEVAVIYAIGMFITYSIAYWIDPVEFENEPGLIYVATMGWPFLVFYYIGWLPFYGIRKLIDWIKLEQGW